MCLVQVSRIIGVFFFEATAVDMHFLNPSNPELYNSLFTFFKLFFKVGRSFSGSCVNNGPVG
jgi:hypothetical protein